MNINEIPNSKIIDIINKHGRSETEKSVLIDRMITGMTYDELIKKYWSLYYGASKPILKKILEINVKEPQRRIEKHIAGMREEKTTTDKGIDSWGRLTARKRAAGQNLR